MNDLVGYTRLGSLDAMSGLLTSNLMPPLISLNADVEYFLRQSLEQGGEHESGWGSEKLKPALNPERLEFLDQAVENHDLEAVLKSTAPCSQ